MQGGARRHCSNGGDWCVFDGVRNVSPLVLLIKLGFEESKMLGADETKEMKKYD